MSTREGPEQILEAVDGLASQKTFGDDSAKEGVASAGLFSLIIQHAGTR
jgi:hypothetical protein